jgi:hypothetical protein
MIAFLLHYLEGLFGILASDNRDFRLKALRNRERTPPSKMGRGNLLDS